MTKNATRVESGSRAAPVPALSSGSTQDIGFERPAGLWNKMLYIMEHSGHLQKTGWNKEHGYHFVEETAVLAHIRPLLVLLGLVLVFDEEECEQVMRKGRNGEVSDITKKKVRYTLVDADSGEKHTWCVYGYGQDSLDKGPYKALTGAHKYAIMKTFQIPTGDDPEADLGEGQQREAEQSRRQERRPPPQQAQGGSEAAQQDPMKRPVALNTMNVARTLLANPLLREKTKRNAEEFLAEPRTEGEVLGCIATMKKRIEAAEKAEEEAFARSRQEGAS